MLWEVKSRMIIVQMVTVQVKEGTQAQALLLKSTITLSHPNSIITAAAMAMAMAIEGMKSSNRS